MMATRCASLLSDRDKNELAALCEDRVRFDEPLAPYTSWKIGGPADASITIESESQLAEIMRFCLRRSMPWFVLGSGSNLLIGDGGLRGIVLRLSGAFTHISVHEDQTHVIVQA
ncbi:MAG: FAD-binding protein, partial [Candidatus Eremiobacteraeota bacterium]|nr:FAD-binding protein [Candidatus Eremiobacteraeota bacterium]